MMPFSRTDNVASRKTNSQFKIFQPKRYLEHYHCTIICAYTIHKCFRVIYRQLGWNIYLKINRMSPEALTKFVINATSVKP